MPLGEPYPPGVPRALGDGLTLRAVLDADDVERVSRFNRELHGPEGEAWSRWLLGPAHPHNVRENFLYVEDDATGAIVASLGLIPRIWAYEGIPLQAGQVELVGTLPAYRHRGLIRVMMQVVEGMLRVRGCHLACIAGIPYFYRQFGYEYVLPLSGGWHLAPGQIPPAGASEGAAYTARPLTDADLATAAAIYDEHLAGLCVTLLRDEAIWRYHTTAPSVLMTTHALVGPDQELVGYFRLEPRSGSGVLQVSEAALRPSARRREALLAILRYAAGRLAESGDRKVGVPLWEGHPLAELAKYLGAERVPAYAWQVRITDEATFLRRIAPALEGRLAASPLAGLDGTLDFNLMRRLLRLRFAAGRLVAVEDEGFQQEAWMARFPPGVATMLLLGYRSREELCNWYPDASVRPEARQLVDVLFPRRVSHVFAL